MKRHTIKRRPPHDANINVTSLLDITFVLLIAFMVVAPALRFNVDLELPQASDAEVVTKEKPVTIHVTWSETEGLAAYHVNGEQVDFGGVMDILGRLNLSEGEQAIALEADRRVPWDNVARLITTLKANGYKNLGIVTEHGTGA